MKRTISAMLAALVCAVACTTTGPVSEPKLNVDGLSLGAGNEVVVPAAGLDVTFSITSNLGYTVTSSQSWASVTPAAVSNEDGKDVKTAVTVAVAANETAEAREAVIKVVTEKNPALDYSFTVKQSGAQASASILVTTTDLKEITEPISVAETETTASVLVQANVAWTATSDKEWLTVSPASATADKEVTTVTFSIEANLDEEPRTATVTFAGEGVDPITITVNQTVPFKGNALLMSVSDFNPEYLSQYPDETSLGAIWGAATAPVVAGYYGLWKASLWDEILKNWESSLETIIRILTNNGRAMDSSVLNLINGEDGIIGTIFSGLFPDTEYILVVSFQDEKGNVHVTYSKKATKAIEYSGKLKMGDYRAYCYVEGETEEESFECAEIFTLAPTMTANLFYFINPVIDDGSRWYAYYDENTNKLTLNGYEFGYEDDGNQFGKMYGKFNSQKYYAYFVESYAKSFDEDGTAECVFSVNDEGYVSGLDNYAFGSFVYQMDESWKKVVSYLGAYNLFYGQNTVITPYTGEETPAVSAAGKMKMSYKKSDMFKNNHCRASVQIPATAVRKDI